MGRIISVERHIHKNLYGVKLSMVMVLNTPNTGSQQDTGTRAAIQIDSIGLILGFSLVR